MAPVEGLACTLNWIFVYAKVFTVKAVLNLDNLVLLDIAENLKLTIQDKNITEDSKHEYYHNVVKPNIDLWGCLLNYYDIFDMILQRHIGDDMVFTIQTKLFNTMFNFIKNSMNKPINRKQFLKDLTEIAS